MAIGIGRRQFLSTLGGTAAAWPLAARAQEPVPVIGYLGSSSLIVSTDQLAGIRQGLKEVGYIEGQNVTIELHWADGHYELLPEMAADLVGRKVSIVFAGGLPAAIAAKAATATVPIVFVVGADPVTSGIVPSLNRPGGNVTGVSQFYGALGGKRLELLRAIAPTATTIAVLSDPNNPNAKSHLSDVQTAAAAMRQQIEIATARTEGEIAAAFATFVRGQARALLVADDPFFTTRRDQIVSLAAQQNLPAIYYAREFAAAGGLISYGSSSRENNRLAAVYVGRILKGAKPEDLPVLQPTQFELIINLKTAKALGLTIPQSLLATADEVIE
jgi:putative tryptophan/tyrosine transport system substrate-binding protein